MHPRGKKQMNTPSCLMLVKRNYIKLWPCGPLRLKCNFAYQHNNILIIVQHIVGLEIISRLAPVKLFSQTYFCSDTTSFWPDKYPLRHLYKSPPPLLHTPTQSLPPLPPPPPPPRRLFLKMDIFFSILAFRPHLNSAFRFLKTVPRVEFF